MKTIKINGFNCRYELSGNQESDETVVFINGIASMLESWDCIKNDLESDYKLLGYELRGQWRSEVTNEKPYTFMTMADDLNALMDALGIDDAHIVSTSLGGEVAQWFALYYPHKVKSLSIIASVSEANMLQFTQVSRWKESAKNAVEQIDASNNDDEIRRKVAYEYYQTLLPELYSNTYLENNEEIINERTEGFVSVCTRDFFQGHVHLCDMFFRLRNEEKITGRLHEITCPALVVAGEVDIIKPVQFSEIIADGIPNSRLEVLSDVGHAILHEKNEYLATMVKEFIDEHSQVFAGKYYGEGVIADNKMSVH